MIFLYGLLLRILVFLFNYSFDVNNHMGWGKELVLFGFRGFYDRVMYGYTIDFPNYPPLAYYLFSLGYLIDDFFIKTAWFLNTHIPLFPSKMVFLVNSLNFYAAILKIPYILADIGIAYLFWKITKRKLAAGLVLFSPVFWYVSALWGQIESLAIFFLVLCCFFLVAKKRPVLAVISLALALLSKQTVIVFVPIFLFLFLRMYPLKSLIKGMAASYIIFFLAFLPFANGIYGFLFPFEIYFRRILFSSGLPFVSNHAFNIWPLLIGWNNIRDTNLFGPLPFRVWGYIIAGLAYLLVIFGTLKNKKISADTLTKAFFLSGFLAFLFLTKIHERHLLQTLPFLIIMAVKNKKYLILYFVISTIMLVNFYHNWAWPEVPLLVGLIRNSLTPYFLSPLLLGSFIFILRDFLQSDNIVNRSDVNRRRGRLKGKNRN